MKKVFRYSYKSGYPVLAIIAIFMGLLFYGLFSDVYSSESNGYRITALIIVAGFYYCIFLGLQHNGTKVLVNNDTIILDIPFKSQRVFKWHAIKEFGRYKVIGVYGTRGVFYIKTVESCDKKILLFKEMIVNRQGLVNIILTKADNAKFVTIRNISSIPFIKNTIIEEWSEAKDAN
jgi:hypothetical protein